MHIRATDIAGNTANVASNRLRLDNTVPIVIFGTNGNETFAQSHSTTVSVSDAHSGVNTRQFVWATSATTPITGWQAFSSGATITTPATTTDDLFLHIRATDSAGNTTNVVSNRFRLDNTGPTIMFNPATGNSNISISVTASLSAVGASFSDHRFVVSEATVRPTAGWSSWSSANTRNITLNNEGVWYFHIEARDSVGNITYQRGGPYTILLASIDGLTLTHLVNPPAGTSVPVHFPASSPVRINTGFLMTFRVNYVGLNEMEVRLFADGVAIPMFTDDGENIVLFRNISSTETSTTFSFWTDRRLPINSVLDMRLTLRLRNAGGTVTHTVKISP